MWSWVLEGIGLLATTIVGRKIWWGWVILITNAILWAVYGLVTKQYGFCAASIFYGPIYARNAYRWYHQKEIVALNKDTGYNEPVQKGQL
jgi:hypothetical protein